MVCTGLLSLLLLCVAVGCTQAFSQRRPCGSVTQDRRFVFHGGYVSITIDSSDRDCPAVDEGDIVYIYCPPFKILSRYITEISQLPMPTDKLVITDANSKRNGPHWTVSVGPFLNTRDNQCNFYYIKGSSGRVVVLGPKIGLIFLVGGKILAERFEPLQAHLSLTGNDREIRLTWISMDVNVFQYVKDTDPKVVYWPTRKAKQKRSVSASGHTYNWTDMCGSPAKNYRNTWQWFRPPGTIYEAVLTGLEPRTSYTYWYGAENLSKILESRTFVSPPLSGNPNDTVSVIAISDLGVWGAKALPASSSGRSSPAKTAIDGILNIVRSVGLNLVTHLGGLSFASGRSHMWERFSYLIEPLATQVPYHVVAGEYEYGPKSGGECGVPFNKRFHMPQKQVAGRLSNGAFWYSHNVGNVHLAYISVEHNISKGSEQFEWLKSDLRAVDRYSHPWVFVLGSQPLIGRKCKNGQCSPKFVMWMNSTSKHNRVARGVLKLLHRFKVDLYLSGGHRAFSHTCSLARNKALCNYTEHGPRQVTVCTPSANIDDVPRTSSKMNKLWTYPDDIRHGFTYIKTHGWTTAESQFMSVNGHVLHTKWLSKPGVHSDN